MRLMFIGLFLLSMVAPAAAQQQQSTAGAGEEATLLISLGGADKGAGFLRQAKPTLERLGGRVQDTSSHRNTVLNRQETEITLAFPSLKAAQDFMPALAAASSGGSPTASSISGSCGKEGTKKVCYFRFFNIRVVCVQSQGSTGACAAF
jgi:hypothetical protein